MVSVFEFDISSFMILPLDVGLNLFGFEFLVFAIQNSIDIGKISFLFCC